MRGFILTSNHSIKLLMVIVELFSFCLCLPWLRNLFVKSFPNRICWNLYRSQLFFILGACWYAEVTGFISLVVDIESCNWWVKQVLEVRNWREKKYSCSDWDVFDSYPGLLSWVGCRIQLRFETWGWSLSL